MVRKCNAYYLWFFHHSFSTSSRSSFFLQIQLGLEFSKIWTLALLSNSIPVSEEKNRWVNCTVGFIDSMDTNWNFSNFIYHHFPNFHTAISHSNFHFGWWVMTFTNLFYLTTHPLPSFDFHFELFLVGLIML